MTNQKQVKQAASTLGKQSWQRLQEELTPEELAKRQSAAGKLGGRPRKE